MGEEIAYLTDVRLDANLVYICTGISNQRNYIIMVKMATQHAEPLSSQRTRSHLYKIGKINTLCMSCTLTIFLVR